ncbi:MULTISPECIES: hypothetical protein [Chryseobacterium]|uniref:Uncharacterized protein n=1 Tax=Chryseobacterium endophyticum TaxID=1854762 RepID=A0AAU6WSU8_9FLAO|nr:hypothetical protein [uncultured Chryseobacterium sp.]
MHLFIDSEVYILSEVSLSYGTLLFLNQGNPVRSSVHLLYRLSYIPFTTGMAGIEPANQCLSIEV